MKQSIILLAVLVAASTQAAAHPAGDHSNADHKHGLFEGIVEKNTPTKKFRFSPAVCNDPSVQYEDYKPIFEGCMYAHRNDIAMSGKGTAGYQARQYITRKCERTACDPSWLDQLRYK